MKGVNIDYRDCMLKSINLSIPYDDNGEYIVELDRRFHNELGFICTMDIDIEETDWSHRLIVNPESSIVDESYLRLFEKRHHKMLSRKQDKPRVNAFVYAVQMRHNIFLSRDLNKVKANNLFDLAYRYDEYFLDYIPYVDDGLRFNKYGNIMILGIRYYTTDRLGQIRQIAVEDIVDKDSILIDFIHHLRLNNGRKVFVLSEDDNELSALFKGTMKTFKEISIVTLPNT